MLSTHVPSNTGGGGTKYSCDQSENICKDVKLPRAERIPCCVCIPVNSNIKDWKCGKGAHSGVITQEVINFCHPALEYNSQQFNQAMDDDILPGAGYCENNFAAGKSVLYQFYCDEATGSLQCGGGNRGHGRSFVLGNGKDRISLSIGIVMIGFWGGVLLL